MNFKKYFLELLVFFLLIAPVISAQQASISERGMPYIQNYELKAFGYQNQTYSIAQDHQGVLYFGNVNGVLRFDGYNWNVIPLKGIPKLIAVNESLFAAGFNNFGYISNDKNGLLSFTNCLSEEFSSMGQVTNVLHLKDFIYFTTKNQLIQYTIDSKSFKRIDSCASPIKIKLIKTDNKKEILAYHSFKKGLLTFSDGKTEPLIPGKTFKNEHIDHFFSYQGVIYIIQAGNTFKYTKTGIQKIKSDVYENLSRYGIHKFLELSNGLSVVATHQKGLFLISDENTLVGHFSEENGLPNNTVYDVFIDAAGNLWVSHHFGISRVEFPSPYTYYNKNFGLEGSVKSILRHQNTIYVATDIGVYALNKENVLHQGILNRFRKIKNSDEGANILYQMKGELYYTSSRGIYKIENQSSSLFYKADFKNFNVVEVSNYNPNLIYLGTDKGLLVLKYEDERWNKIGVLQNFGYSIQNILEENDGSVWVVTDYYGCFRIPPNDFFDINASIDQFRISKGLPNDIQWITPVKTSDQLLFMTSKGVYKYQHEQEQFVEDNQFGREFSTSDRWIYPIVEDKDKNYWYSEVITDQNFTRSTFVARYNQLSNNRNISKLPLNKIQKFDIECIYPDKDQVIWFGGNKGLVRFNYKQLLNQERKNFNVIINGITSTKDTLTTFLPIYGNTDRELKLSQKDIKIECAATDYESGNQIMYQYRLKNFNKNWTEWSNSNYKEYTNLKEGKYIFEVRAKNINETVANTSSLNFEIVKPIYKSTLAIILYALAAILFGIMFIYWMKYFNAKEKFKLETIINKRTNELLSEKERSENLITRVIQKQTINDFVKDQSEGTKRIKMATALFSDIHGFRFISEQINSERLIDELDSFALQYEKIVKKFNLERIKTIGDMYLCVGGIPDGNRTNPIEAIMAAIELQNYMKEIQKNKHEQIWDLRIGIDTGPVIVGLSGRRKKSFDVWGATVNTANRLESAGEPGKINISGNTYMLVKDYFNCKYYGKVPVKNKGDIDMFYVEGFKPHFSKEGINTLPNDNFITQLQLLRLGDLEEFVLAKLEGLPDNLYYHNLKHTVDVYTQVELIGRSESISKESLLLIRTAALFHDMGHLIDYFTHEEQGVKLANEILPKFAYSTQQIEKICELILATRMPHQPKNKLEEIICDADLDYLGRSDFIPVSNKLYKELRERGHLGTLKEWNIMQMNFLEKHEFFTETARSLRDKNKQDQLVKIRKIVEQESNLEE